MTEEKKIEKMHTMVLTKTDKIEINPLQFTIVNYNLKLFYIHFR